jgi:hypothetical protein
MFRNTIVASALFMSIIAPAYAQDNVAASTTMPAKPEKPKKICRQDVDTGSVMMTTTCHTKEEWQQIDSGDQAQSDRALQNLHRSAGMGH